MPELTKGAAQQQLANEVKWWRQNCIKKKFDWQTRAGWSSQVGNNPARADSIQQSDYNAMANQWCGVATNTHKKRTTRVDASTGHTIFKEADTSLSGGKGSCHFIESWSDGTKFNWHFKVV